MRRKKPKDEPWRWQALATYNAERARGLVHTEEWQAQMAQEQAAWAEERRQDPRGVPVEGPTWKVGDDG